MTTNRNHDLNNIHGALVGGQLGDTRASNPAMTSGREDLEALSTGAEEANVHDNIDALADYARHAGNSRDFNERLIESLFTHGKPGQYAARTTTLTTKVASLLGSDLKDLA